MADVVLLLLATALGVTAMLRIWFHSWIFSATMRALLTLREVYRQKTGIRAKIALWVLTLTTCWQCLSVWLGLAVAGLFVALAPLTFVQGWVSAVLTTFVIGLGAALLSEIIDRFVLCHLTISHAEELEYERVADVDAQAEDVQGGEFSADGGGEAAPDMVSDDPLHDDSEGVSEGP